MDWSQLIHPTLILNTAIAQRNLARMAQKAAANHCTFRPHFKTHQSAFIGEWYRDYGVTCIAVSSAQMALYFANCGWRDILVSFPFHPAQWKTLQFLAKAINLGVLVSNRQSAIALSQLADTSLQVWVEIDTGQGRTGMPIDQQQEIQSVITTLQQNINLQIAGFHIHAGQSYACRNKEALNQLGERLIPGINQLRAEWIIPNGWQLSFGDTPLCSVLKDLSFADELRPGNFIFYDLMQVQIGACQPEDIAVAVACPVVDTHFIYGGAVHLSKDQITAQSQPIFGTIAQADGLGWQVPDPLFWQPLRGLSQEHGWLAPEAPSLTYSSVVPVLPVHSCLTVEALPYYLTTTGKRIEKFSVKMMP